MKNLILFILMITCSLNANAGIAKRNMIMTISGTVMIVSGVAIAASGTGHTPNGIAVACAGLSACALDANDGHSSIDLMRTLELQSTSGVMSRIEIAQVREDLQKIRHDGKLDLANLTNSDEASVIRVSRANGISLFGSQFILRMILGD